MDKIADAVGKSRVNYFGHLYQMDGRRQTKTIFYLNKITKKTSEWRKKINHIVELDIKYNSSG